ncbi:STAS domain-containing protein [Planosporangium sp. 12N6]|uniref:STAS domain-containing protein n=1 Tax=Planosporangium spinosum TaxID=3402278 RepID=UPI003CEFECBF
MTGLTLGSIDLGSGDGSSAPHGECCPPAPGKEGMRITKHVVDSVTVVGLIGELDARTAPLAQEQLSGALPDGTPALLDLSRVGYVSSAGLRTMLMVYRRAQRTGTPIVLVGASETLRGILSATGFLRFFEVASTIPGGIAALRAG